MLKKQSAESDFSAPFAPGKSGLRQNDLVTFLQGHDRLFPIRGATGGGCALSSRLPADIQRVDLDNLDFKEFLNRLANLGLVRARVGPDRVLIELLTLPR